MFSQEDTKLANAVMRIDDTAAASCLIKFARSTIQDSCTDLAGTWPRVVSILARQALEIALSQLWSQVLSEDDANRVQRAPMRAQLLCLPEYINTELANSIRHTWHDLSNACHHHAYDLPPIATELNSWLIDIEKLTKIEPQQA